MVYQRRTDLIAEHIEGETVILDLGGGRVHQLNATASGIWEACDGSHTPDDIATALVATFDGAPDAPQLHAEVRGTLVEFERLGLVTAVVSWSATTDMENDDER